MGEVYRAHDPRLGRDVALKVLPADMASDPLRLERFTREARAIAALNHPHIVTIYSTEEADGVRFLTMELVEGQPLDALIPPTGLPLTRFLELALPLADALNAAHQKRITHRDLKPANVMVASDGRVKVLDFGLASAPVYAHEGDGFSAADLATSPLVTTPGTVIGTMPYMSPEQVEGKQLDHRTDLFTLGVMFHEMLAGTRPFTGDSSAQLMSSILRDSPSSLSDLRADVPEPLSRLISSCLEKQPEDRVQTARDVYNELRHVQKQLESGQFPGSFDEAARQPPPSARTVGSPWIAVIPFAAGTDEESLALADGLTDDITTGIARFPYLSVVAAHSDRQQKGATADAKQIGSALGARYILEGGIRRAGSTMRISARLVDASSGAHLWAERFNRDLTGGPFTVQDDVASRVVSRVADPSGVLVRSMVASLRDKPAAAMTVADLTLQYFAHIETFTPEQHAQLRDALEQALEREPNDATGWACLANLYAQEHEFELNPRPDSVERQRRAAERAIAIDATCQYGWVNLAASHYFSRDLAAFHHEAERAIALNPLNTQVLQYLGTGLALAGNWDRGAALLRHALALNPNLPGHAHLIPFLDHYRRGEDEAALVDAKKINVPGLHTGHYARAAASGQLERREEARTALDDLRRVNPEMADPGHARTLLGRFIHDGALVDRLVEGVEKALAITGTLDRPLSEKVRP